MENVIELKHVYKVYHPGENEVRALYDISLQVPKGQFLSVVGTSGSGKSTMMHIIGCLDTPSAGEYFLDRQRVSDLNDKALSDIRNRQIGFIFQGFNLIPNLSALENVELPLIYRGVKKARRREIALEALEQVGLFKRATHRPSQMSGGQQQRTAIARAIAAKPPIILADEPTGNLDSRSGQDVMEILKSLHREGKTVVLITHDDKVAQTAQRIIRISDGEIADDRMVCHADGQGAL